MNSCLTCQSLTSNPKFCGKSCAAKYNNKRYQKRKLERTNCSKCGDLIGRKSFTDRRIKVGLINSLDNLVGLCPNHHWEFDNSHLEFTEFEGLHS